MNRAGKTPAAPAGAVLHLRERRMGWVALGLPALTATAWWSAGWLSSRPYFGGADARVPVVAFASLLAAVLISLTLAGADIDLTRTASRLTARHRAVHSAVAATAVCALLALVATDTPQTFGSYALIRNSLGLIGMVLLATAVLPAALTWAPAFVYTLVIYLAAPSGQGHGAQWWAWIVQPGDPDPSWVVAIVLLATGVVLYTRGDSAQTAHQSNW